jgi:hypothetical protein
MMRSDAVHTAVYSVIVSPGLSVSGTSPKDIFMAMVTPFSAEGFQLAAFVIL